jgi:hypothetical protein
MAREALTVLAMNGEAHVSLPVAVPDDGNVADAFD